MSSAATNGPYIIGYTLSFGLMGALCVQAYIYFTRFPDDRRAIKTLVTTIFILEMIMTTATFAGFWISVTESGAINFLGPGVVFVGLVPITGLVTTLTHAFFCWRIANIRKSLLIPIPIMMLSLFQLASIIYLDFTDGFFPSNATVHDTYASFPPTIAYSVSPWLVAWLGSSAVCDLTITICMTMILRPSNSHFQSNKSTLRKLTRLTIETGLVTTIAALVELILGIVFKDHMYHIAVFFAISKLYANGLLASLNFRLVVRSQSNPSATAIVWDDTTSNTRPTYSMANLRSKEVRPILARVQTDVAVESDGGNPLKSNLVSDQSSAA